MYDALVYRAVTWIQAEDDASENDSRVDGVECASKGQPSLGPIITGILQPKRHIESEGTQIFERLQVKNWFIDHTRRMPVRDHWEGVCKPGRICQRRAERYSHGATYEA